MSTSRLKMRISSSACSICSGCKGGGESSAELLPGEDCERGVKNGSSIHKSSNSGCALTRRKIMSDWLMLSLTILQICGCSASNAKSWAPAFSLSSIAAKAKNTLSGSAADEICPNATCSKLSSFCLAFSVRVACISPACHFARVCWISSMRVKPSCRRVGVNVLWLCKLRCLFSSWLCLLSSFCACSDTSLFMVW